MKKILMLLAFAGVASVASAQQTMTVTEYEVIQVQDKYQVITNPFWSNWFFSVGGGAQVLYFGTRTGRIPSSYIEMAFGKQRKTSGEVRRTEDSVS